MNKKNTLKKGKIAGKVLKRSIWQPASIHPQNSGKSAGIGDDCAFFSYGDSGGSIVAAESFTLPSDRAVDCAIIKALNKVAAGKGLPTGIILSVLLPPGFAEEGLKAIFVQAKEVCRLHAVELIDGYAEVSDGVNRPIITVTAMGEPTNEASAQSMILPGQEVVVSKWIALEGTALIASGCTERLAARFPTQLVEEVCKYDRYLSILSEAACAIKTGVKVMVCAGNGGIFATLWALAESAGLGILVNLKSIPVKQETIEVCEYMGVNPYELLCGGMLVMVTDDGQGMVEALARVNISGTVIGKMTAGHDRII
ncbi:MAG: hydrogenase maturation factor, partial [Lachnospiraceae bacterium]|nr:hydrogenase maturation factor [Lachnospiraceae bacterium]